MVRCPFHGGGKENTPSCSLSHTKPVFMCFSCGTGGHITKYLKAIGTPIDSAKKLVESVSYDYGEAQRSFSVYKGKNPFRGEYLLDDDILDEWRLRPESLYRAGFTERTLRHFEVGVDNAACRITFPIRNIYGELVGVSGRAMYEGVEPRYKVYSAKDLRRYNVPLEYTAQDIKSATFWHAHLVYPICFRSREPIVLCEGFKAAMWVWQSGYHNVVAMIGAYLSRYQASLLAQTQSKVILFLDNNKAGHTGTHKAAKSLAGKNLTYVANYPDVREQPDNLGPAEVLQSIETATHYTKWRYAE